MTIIPIQVTDEGVLIPKVYLHDAGELELLVTAEYVLVRPKHPSLIEQETSRSPRRYSFIGIAHTRNPRASVEAEEVLEREFGREQSG